MAYIGKTPVVGNFQICDAISVVNGQAAYTLQVGSANVIPQSANHMIVSLNGVIQKPGSSFTVSGSTMTFASNLATGDSIDFVQILGNVLDIGTPSDATVTSAKLATLTSAMNFQGVASDMRLNFDTTDTIANASPLMAITAKNKTDSVAQISMRRESSVSDGYIAFSTQSTGGALNEKVRIHSGGVMSATQGIALGVGTANTASNVLDDYEEGTFQPTVTDTAGNVTINLNSSYNTLAYKKVGKICFISGSLVVSSISGSWSGGTTKITLPFTSGNTAQQSGKSFMNLAVYNTDLTNSGTYAYFAVLQNDSAGEINCARDNGTTGAGQVSSSAQLYFGGAYATA